MSLEKHLEKVGNQLEVLNSHLERLQSVKATSTEGSKESKPPAKEKPAAKEKAAPAKKKATRKKTASKKKPTKKGAADEGLKKVRALANQASRELGKEAVMDLLEEYGVDNLTGLDASDYDSFASDLKDAMAEGQEESEDEDEDDDDF